MEMEAGGSSSKRRRSASPGVGDEDGGFGADRISALPDAILGEIISLLPTREGARTQILASRWRHIWRSAPLNLNCNNLGYRDFAGVVSRILSSHQGPGRRFCVSFDMIATPSEPNGDPANTKSAVVNAWLSSPALNNLQKLDVHYSLERPLLPFSASILRFSTTLRVVSLVHCNISDSTGQGLHFPKLQQLALIHVSVSECTLNHMIAGCPALECLLIDESFGFRCVRINSPCLASIGVYAECHTPNALLFEELIIENAPVLKRLLHFDHSYRSIKLHISVLSAPKLETLRCVLNCRNYLSTKLSFGSTIIQGLHVDSLIVAVSSVKILDVVMSHLSLDIVINLMRCFPSLEKLYIQVVQPCRTSEKKLWRRKFRNIAKCLDIRLKTIMVNSYWGGTSEVNFVTFFLLNARALESIILVVRTNDEELIAKHSRKLQLENGASRGVRFYFTNRMGASYWEDVRCLLIC